MDARVNNDTKIRLKPLLMPFLSETNKTIFFVLTIANFVKDGM